MHRSVVPPVLAITSFAWSALAITSESSLVTNQCGLSGAPSTTVGIPRRTWYGGSTSSNVSSYPIVTVDCAQAAGSAMDCDLIVDLVKGEGTTNVQLGMAPDGDKDQLAYLQGLLYPSLLLVIFGGMVLLWGLYLAFSRYVLGICGNPSCADDKCRTVRCGSAYPTIRRKGCLGLKKDAESGDYVYSWTARPCTMLMMGAYAITMCCLVGFAQVWGNESISKMAPAVTASGDGFVSLTTSMDGPISSLAIAMGGSVLRPLLLDSASILAATTSWQDAASAAACASGALSSLPSPASLESERRAASGQLATHRAALSAASQAALALASSRDLVNHAPASVNGTGHVGDGLRASFQLSLSGSVAAFADLDALKASAFGLAAPGRASNRVAGSALAAQPTQSEIDQVAADVDSAASAGSSLAEADAAALQADLNQTLLAVQAAPDLAFAASQLAQHNALLATTLNASVAQLYNIEEAATALSSNLTAWAASVGTASDGLGQALNHLANGTAPVANALVQAGNLTAPLPGAQALVDEVEAVDAAVGDLSCAGELAGYLDDVNATLMSLPGGWDSLLSIKADIEGAVGNSTSALAPMQAAMDALTSGLNGLSLDSLSAQIANMSQAAAKASSEAEAALESLVVAAAGLASEAAAVASDIRGWASQARAAMQLARTSLVDAAAISTLSQFQTDNERGAAALQSLLSRVGAFRAGYCSDDASLPCAADSDCSSAATCNAQATHKCLDQRDQACSASSVSCTCSLDTTEWAALRSNVSAMPSRTEVDATTSPIASRYELAVTAVNGLNTSEWSIAVNEAIQGVLGVPIPAAETATALVAAADASEQLDSARLLDELRAPSEAANDVAIDTMLQEANSLAEILQAATGKDLDALADVLMVANAAVRWSSSKAASIASTLTAEALWGLHRTGGSASVLSRVVEAADAVGSFIKSVPALPQPEGGRSAGDTMDPVISRLQLLHAHNASAVDEADGATASDELTQAGSFWFFASLIAADDVLALNSPLAHRIWEDAQGFPYPGERVCLSAACIEREVLRWNLEPLRDTAGVALRSSREAIVFVLLMPIAFLALFAAFSCMGFVCCQSPEWQKLPASIFVGVAIVATAILAVVAALFLPAFMAVNDICNTGGPATVVAVQAAEADICRSDWLGHLGTYDEATSECQVEGSLGSASLRIGDVAAEVLTGSCPQDGTGALYDALSAMASQLADKPLTAVNDLLDSAGLQVKGDMRGALDRASATLGTQLEATATRARDEVLTCDAVHGAVLQLASPFCCFLHSSLYWLAAPVCWAMILTCVVGIPAGLMGRKRFPTRPFGVLYHRALRDDKEAATRPAPNSRQERQRHRRSSTEALHRTQRVSLSTAGMHASPNRAGGRHYRASTAAPALQGVMPGPGAGPYQEGNAALRGQTSARAVGQPQAYQYERYQ